ncbi:hypothetical protein B0J13DRAFT_155132 [Dactylonectria estremocensis]|uniref:Heterokaryon incompatibility domain-containing protein n=1 Tax=Dactylonectria estremocensis TaxID=1079267 RepID=A0A9P9DMR3_9HYPO|nr:hypothetical protein B0J13DRAFT_155132 [Dactylonectria estremocensis]
MFQRREAFLSQKTMTKWSKDRLGDYVLLPASNGYVTRSQCQFVSHFWRTRDNPDPGGEYLRLVQRDLKVQTWSYIWVDWTCMPQHPRKRNEEFYFLQSLQLMPGIIRNCAFMWYYPPFEPRLWILYEIAEYTLTCDDGLQGIITPDMKEFASHIDEMLQVGVRSTLSRHGYGCTFDRDKEFLTSWLEVLVLLRKLAIDTDDVRVLMDHLTWSPSIEVVLCHTKNGIVVFCRFEGTLTLKGACHTFTPFPRWMVNTLKLLSLNPRAN